MTVTPATPRRTQAERRRQTRTRLLDATVQCLVERGYADTTTSEVQLRAEVSRGTLLHHFPTKVELLVASIAHIADKRRVQLEAQLAALPAGEHQVDAMVDIAWQHFSSPIFWAALELWSAARTDAELRDALVPVEKDFFELVHSAAGDLLGQRFPGDPRLPTIVEFTLEVITGLVMSTIITGTLGHRELLLRRWKRAVAILLGERDPASLVEGRPPAA